MIQKIKNFYNLAQKDNYQSLILSKKILTYIVLFFIIARAITIIPFLPLPNNIFFADITKIDVFNMLNEKRANSGLQPLHDNSQLDEAALLKAQDMIKNNYFAHESPANITPWYWFSHVNYAYAYAGENLAVGFTDPHALFNAWINSPSHRENILNPNYQDVGSAVITGFGSNNAILIVQLFGSPKAVVAKNNSSELLGPKNQTPQTIKAETNTQEPLAKAGTQPQVLSQQTNSQISPQSQTSIIQNNFYSQLLYTLAYNSQHVLDGMIYATILLVFISYLIMLKNKDTIFHPRAISHLSAFIILILVLTINKDFIYTFVSWNAIV